MVLHPLGLRNGREVGESVYTDQDVSARQRKDQEHLYHIVKFHFQRAISVPFQDFVPFSRSPIRTSIY